MKKNVKVLTCSALSLMLTQVGVFAAEADADSETKKDETVYAMLNADGSVQDEIISSWIHNPSGIKNIEETLHLQNVENVKSDEEPTIDGDHYTWNVEGNDVYYKGNSDQELPISVSITYFLDGVEMKPEELAGKSGKLEIHISMKNNQSKTKVINGVATQIHPLYLAAGVVDLSSDHFANVTCEHAKVLSDGNNQMVGFFTLPGFEDTLESAGIDKAKELPINDTYVIKADATDFELGPIMIAMTPEVPLDQLKDIDSLDELTSGIDRLNEAGNQLLEGSGQLHDASSLFASKMQELNAKVDPLGIGITTLHSGTTQVLGGSTQLTTNLKTLDDGLTQVKEGAQKLYEGTAQMSELVEGITQLKDGAAALNDGVQQVAGGIQLMHAQAVESGQLTQLKSALTTLKGYQGLIENMGDMLNNLKNLNTAFNIANIDPQTGTATLPSLTSLAANTAAGAKQSEGAITAICTAENVQSVLSEEQKAICTQAIQGSSTITSSTAGMNTIIAQMAQGVADMNKQLASLNQDDLNTLAKMIENIDTAIAGIDELETGIQKLNDNMPALTKGAQGLASGTATLFQKTTSLGTLSDGIQQLYGASAQLSEGTHQLYAGSIDLQNGLLQVNEGTKSLVDSTPTLLSGVSALNEASGTLAEKMGEFHNGVQEFKTSGLDELSNRVTLTMDDVNQILAIKDEIVKENEATHTFSGAPQQAESEVKFIYKTKEIKQNKETATTTNTEDEETKDQSLWQKIINFFTNLF